MKSSARRKRVCCHKIKQNNTNQKEKRIGRERKVVSSVNSSMPYGWIGKNGKFVPLHKNSLGAKKMNESNSSVGSSKRQQPPRPYGEKTSSSRTRHTAVAPGRRISSIKRCRQSSFGKRARADASCFFLEDDHDHDDHYYYYDDHDHYHDQQHHCCPQHHSCYPQRSYYCHDNKHCCLYRPPPIFSSPTILIVNQAAGDGFRGNAAPGIQSGVSLEMHPLPLPAAPAYAPPPLSLSYDDPGPLGPSLCFR